MDRQDAPSPEGMGRILELNKIGGGDPSASNRTGRELLLEQLVADGAKYLFGNPGTVEEGFLDALSDRSDLSYVLALHETVALGIADGYARATKRPTFVQLHSGVGLGNGIGMLYEAMRGHAPLVVLAGDAGVRYDALDAQMAADLVGMAKPVTKWASRVTDPGSLLRSVRRAVKIAGTPPMGPVFLALPLDVLDAPALEEVVPTLIPCTRVAPDADVIRSCTEILAGASTPMIIIGDGIAASGAEAELARVAALLGAEVWGADSSEANISATDPHRQGQLGHMFGAHSQTITTRADVVLISGTYVFPEVFPVLSGAFASGARVIHVDLNAYEIGKNFPVDIGIVADPKLTLAAIADDLESTLQPEQREAARLRSTELARARQSVDATEREADRRRWNEIPLQAARFMAELAARLPNDAVIFDEALTTSPDLTRYLPPQHPGSYFQTRGGSLGVGIPGAIGLKLANPGRTVVGFTGDGGAMYTIQALWTAVHHGIDAKFVVCNNRSYRILKLNIQQYWRERGIEGRDFPASFDLGGPELRFDHLAHAMNVPAARVERPDEITPVITRALETDGPFLIDLVIDGDVPREPVHVKCGQ
jgi:thiamine pyrophosphate-dependent acetolactate synthase large subunit-like protein